MSPGTAGALVVIPARNEQALVAAALRSVLAAAEVARQEDPGLRTLVVLVANRCTDATVPVARAALGREGVVLVDDSGTVGAARAAGVEAGMARLSRLRTRDVWVFSTDADTEVPPTWIRDVRRHGARGAVALTGLIELGAGLPAGVRSAHDDVVRAGLRPDGHDHVYAANLAVRADVLAAVGGWPDLATGEDAALVDALCRAGHTPTTALDVVVRTSARRRPRARGGLGDLLAALGEDQSVASSMNTIAPM